MFSVGLSAGRFSPRSWMFRCRASSSGFPTGARALSFPVSSVLSVSKQDLVISVMKSNGKGGSPFGKSKDTHKKIGRAHV